MLFACGASTVPATAKPEIALNRTLPLVLAVALFMEHMDSTVISTALPAIAADLGTSPVALKLALTAYLVSLAIFIPISGWMADRYGARRVFRTAIAVFIAGSVLCALSGSLTAFVASRFVQGMGGAMMTPLARLMLVRGTPRSDLVNAMAWLTVPALIGPMVGPPVGGFITTYVSWHWIFIINVPIGLAGILISGFVLPKIETHAPPPMDWAGFLLAAICWTHGLGPTPALSMFAAGRLAGWLAHALEQQSLGRLIRPRARYTGLQPDADADVPHD